MSSIRDAGVVLVLLLLATTIRVDQPMTASVIPPVQAAAAGAAAPEARGPETGVAAMPANQTTEVPVEMPGNKLCKMRVVRVETSKQAAVIRLGDVETQFVFVGPNPRPVVRPTLG